MGTSLFTWKVRYGEVREGLEGRHERHESVGGTEFVRAFGKPRFVAPEVNLIFSDNTSGQSLADWITFYTTTISNGSDSFLYKARHPSFFRVEGEALGTASGGGGETFTTAKKFVAHTDFGESTSTLVVYVNGTPQTITTDYTVSLNGTTPTITTTASFDTGTVTCDYDYYRQVRIVEGFDTEFLVKGTTLSLPGAQTSRISIREVTPGGSDA